MGSDLPVRWYGQSREHLNNDKNLESTFIAGVESARPRPRSGAPWVPVYSEGPAEADLNVGCTVC